MTEYRVQHKSPDRQGIIPIELPASKSISNRALILNQIRVLLGADSFVLKNLSEADDTKILTNAFQTHSGKIDIRNAGTCLRFLTAFFAASPGVERVMTGNDRMLDRPITGLLNPLRELGANIQHLDQNEKLPIKISGGKLRGGKIKVAAETSSQFASALMMVGPLMETDLELELMESPVSLNYLKMTFQMMGDFGFRVETKNNFQTILVQAAPPLGPSNVYNIEPDWSSAAFFYEACALKPDLQLLLQYLSPSELQGDSILANWMTQFGVVTEFTSHGAVIGMHNHADNRELSFDFMNHPDLAPAICCTAVFSGRNFFAGGLGSLKYKESNRLTALKEIFEMVDLKAIQVEKNTLQWNYKGLLVPKTFHVNTHADHRLIMAYSMIVMKHHTLFISNFEEVEKSFPEFWQEVAKLGISVE